MPGCRLGKCPGKEPGKTGSRRGNAERDHVDLNSAHSSVLGDAQSTRVIRDIVGLGLRGRCPDISEQASAQHPKQVEAGHSWGGFEIKAAVRPRN